MDPIATGERLNEVFEGYPELEDPVARIQAVTVRDEAVEQLRTDLAQQSWLTAWGGRALTTATSVTVDPSLPAPQVSALEDVVGVAATPGEVALGRARVALAADDEEAVGS